MSLSRVLLFLVLFCLVLVFGALAYLHFADLNQYKGQIVSRVQEATGRDFTLGALDIDIWPRVRVSVDELALANAPWGSDPKMLRLARLDATLKPLSLMFRPIRVTDLAVQDMTLLLESDDSGRGNWNMAPGSELPKEGAGETGGGESGSTAGGIPVRLDKLDITNVAITRRHPGGKDQSFMLELLHLQPDAENLRRLVGKGEILKQPLVLNGRFDVPGEQAGRRSQSFQINGQWGSLELAINGVEDRSGLWADTRAEAVLQTDDIAAFLASIDVSTQLSGPLRVKAVVAPGKKGQAATIDARLDTLAAQLSLVRDGDQLAVDGKVSGLAGFGKMMGVEGLPANPVALEGSLTRGGEGLEIQELHFVSEQARLSATGRLGSAQRNTRLQLKLEGESLSDLLTTMPGLAFDGTAQLESSPAAMIIDPLSLRFGASDISGSVQLASGGDGLITVALTSDKLDLKEFFPIDEGAADDVEEKEAHAPADKQYVFGKELLPFEALQKNELDFTLAAEQLISHTSILEQLDLSAGLHGGELKVAADFATAVGGRSASRLQLKTSGQEAELRAVINARDLRVNLASGEDAAPEEIPPMSVSFNVVASGSSPRELASTSTGDLLVTLGGGRLENKLIGRFTGDIVSQLSAILNPFAAQEPDTRFQCGVMALAIADGISTLEPLILQGEKVTIVGEGEIDLKTEEIMVKFNTQPRKGIGISADMFVTPFVTLDGTLAHPRVGANKKGTAITVATAGLSLLVRSARDRIAGDIDHCVQTMPTFEHPPLSTGEGLETPL